MAISALLALGGCNFTSSYYFVCKGDVTKIGTAVHEPVEGVSAAIRLYPAITRLWSDGTPGDIVVDSYRIYLRITNANEVVFYFYDKNIGFGAFDRISRHLMFTAAGKVYDLQCRDVVPVGE